MERERGDRRQISETELWKRKGGDVGEDEKYTYICKKYVKKIYINYAILCCAE